MGLPVRSLNQSAFEDGKARLISGPAILVIVIGATAAKMSLMRNIGATNQQITAFELQKDRVVPDFAIQQLRLSQEWLRSTASTATIPILDSGIVSRLPIAFPNCYEQTAIFGHITEDIQPFDIVHGRTERDIDLLREYRTRLTADVVTGKLDVREAVKRLPAEPSENAEEFDQEEALDEIDAEEIEA